MYLLDMRVERTTTAECVLGLLSIKPMSGYELRQMMDRTTANFWSESFGQIYPALKKLVVDGLAEMEVSHPQGQRLRKVYRLTAAGRERLGVWLSLPAEPQVNRDELLLKLFFGVRSSPQAMKVHLEGRRQKLQQELRHYVQIERTITQERAGDDALPFYLMTVRYGIAEATALVAWCDQSLKALEPLMLRTGSVTQRRRDDA